MIKQNFDLYLNYRNHVSDLNILILNSSYKKNFQFMVMT